MAFRAAFRFPQLEIAAIPPFSEVLRGNELHCRFVREHWVHVPLIEAVA